MFKAIKLMRVKKGILTSPYPVEPDSYGPSFKGQPIVDMKKCTQCRECVKNCPTSAIQIDNKRLTFDLGLCIYCGECAKVCSPKAITITPNFELSTKDKNHLQVVFE